jgi:hypothetical protein
VKRTFLLVAFATLTTGCWILAGLEDRPVADGTNPPDGGTDGTTEGSSTDGSIEDAGEDVRTSCRRTFADASFCDDFDDDPLDPTWIVPDGGAVTVESVTTVKFSPPRALRVSGQGSLKGILERTFPLLPTANKVDYVLEGQVRLLSAMGTARVRPPSVMRLSAEGATSIELLLDAPQSQTATCFGAGAQIGETIPFTDDVWHRVKLTIHANGDLSCTVGGEVRRTPTAIGIPAASSVTISVGLDTGAQQGPIAVAFDDVVYW